MPAPMEAPLVLPFSYHCMRERLKGGRLPGLAIQASETAVTWPASEARCLQLGEATAEAPDLRKPALKGAEANPLAAKAQAWLIWPHWRKTRGESPTEEAVGPGGALGVFRCTRQRLGANRNVSSD